MNYTIKWLEETAWLVGISVGIYVLEAVINTDEATNWRAFLVAVGGGAGRLAAAMLLNQLRKLRQT